jgi:hypothetical protein
MEDETPATLHKSDGEWGRMVGNIADHKLDHAEDPVFDDESLIETFSYLIGFRKYLVLVEDHEVMQKDEKKTHFMYVEIVDWATRETIISYTQKRGFCEIFESFKIDDDNYAMIDNIVVNIEEKKISVLYDPSLFGLSQSFFGKKGIYILIVTSMFFGESISGLKMYKLNEEKKFDLVWNSSLDFDVWNYFCGGEAIDEDSYKITFKNYDSDNNIVVATADFKNQTVFIEYFVDDDEDDNSSCD